MSDFSSLSFLVPLIKPFWGKIIIPFLYNLNIDTFISLKKEEIKHKYGLSEIPAILITTESDNNEYVNFVISNKDESIEVVEQKSMQEFKNELINLIPKKI